MTENVQVSCSLCLVRYMANHVVMREMIPLYKYFFRFKPVLTYLSQLKPHVWQKQVFASRNPSCQYTIKVKVKSTIAHEKCWWGAHLPYLGCEPIGG